MSGPVTENRLAASLHAMDLARPGEWFACEPLAGGVSCNVWLVSLASGRKLVLKQALPKLRVQAEWRAPAERSHTEAEWLRLVANVDPQLAPHVLGEDRPKHLLAMEYLPPKQYPVWKEELRAGRINPRFAAQVGTNLARIHARTARDAHVARQFANQAQFRALRLEPYLLYTAEQHPDVSGRLYELADKISDARIALMQGDISPKNILCGPRGPVFLDAETACFGDPAFDLAFCLNHLLLKCVWHSEHTEHYLRAFQALASSYADVVSWEPSSAIEARTTTLLPTLLLARIDGKSPVEYITAPADKTFVRTFAKRKLLQTPAPLQSLIEEWRKALYSK